MKELKIKHKKCGKKTILENEKLSIVVTLPTQLMGTSDR
jgi:hypothetical protein